MTSPSGDVVCVDEIVPPALSEHLFGRREQPDCVQAATTTDCAQLKRLDKVSDKIPAKTSYAVEIPSGWTVSREGALGVRISSILAESPDFEVVQEEVDGPSSLIYYKHGAVLFILETSEEYLGKYHEYFPVLEEKAIQIDGHEAVFHSFQEPSLQQGVLLDAHLQIFGRTYLFRLGYNPNTFPQGRDVFEHVLSTVKFAP